MKILHVIFSCNRIKYLTKTLDSLKNLDYGSHQVDRLILDDYPRNRNEAIFDLLGKSHGFGVMLNEENYGLSLNWTKFFEWVKSKDYDYILHQEDDVVLVRPIKVDDLIFILESNPKMASVVLKRQPWYFWETEEEPFDPDEYAIKGYRYSKNTKTFPIIFSLYRKSIVDIPFIEYWKFNLNEGMIMVYLDRFHQMFSALLKGPYQENLIEHIGEECTGKRVLQGEPNWEQFSHMEPDKIYSSRDGKLVEA